MSKQLSELIEVAPRFRRSIDLQTDVRNDDALDGYVVSPLSRDGCLRVIRGLGDATGNRAWSLIGPYGSGKSSFAAYLATLLSAKPTNSKAMRLFSSAWPTEGKALRTALPSVSPLLPVLVTGERCPISLVLLRGIEAALNTLWAGRGGRPTTLIKSVQKTLRKAEKGGRIKDSDLVDLIVKVAHKVHDSSKPEQGLVIIVDELGKLLEWAAANATESDIYLLQLLAESLSRLSGPRVVFIGVLHQALDAYAQHLPRSDRLEWEKVAGRFETLPFLEPAEHLVRLAGQALIANPATKKKLSFRRAKDIAGRLKLLTGRDGSPSTDELLACFPLNPITAICIGPVFRLRIGQNERSLFSFLTSHEPSGFQAFLGSDPGPEDLFHLDSLFDYLVHNIAGGSANGPEARTLAAGNEALHRLQEDASPLESRVVKATTLLAIIGDQVGLRADADTIRLALDAKKSDVQESLKRLGKASIVVFRKFKSSYQIWDGSDIDVAALVSKARAAVQAEGGLADRLQEGFPPYPVVGNRHYHRTGTLRYLLPRYVGVPSSTATLPSGAKGDGDLFLIVPDDANGLGAFEPETQSAETSADERPRVFALPTDPQTLLNATLDYFGAVDALKDTPELESDPVARRMLKELMLQAEDRLADVLATCFGSGRTGASASWIFGSNRVPVPAGRLSTAASDVFDKIYDQTPCILNELVNREELSSSAASARRSVLERMFSRPGEQSLGITGFPPEMSVYRSVLQETGLHRTIKGVHALTKPPAKSALHAAWRHLDAFYKRHSGARITVAEVMAELARPPIGMRGGIAPFLVIAHYLVHQDRLFLYEDGSFLPDPADDLAYRLIRRPDSVEIQPVADNAATKRVVEALSEAMGLDSATLFDAVLAVVRIASKLTDYAAQTHHLSENAKRVRSTIKAAKDPVKLILDGFPRSVGQASMMVQEASKEEIGEFANALQSALRELQDADTALHRFMFTTMWRLLGAPEHDLDPFYADLPKRAARVAELKDVPAIVSRFAAVTQPLDLTVQDDRSEWTQTIGITLIGKPPSAWDDSDKSRFLSAAMELARGFLGAEELGIELRQRGDSALHLLRVSILGSEGREQNGVVVLRGEQKARVDAFRQEVVRLATERGFEHQDLKYAVIAAMMDLAETSATKEGEATA